MKIKAKPAAKAAKAPAAAPVAAATESEITENPGFSPLELIVDHPDLSYRPVDMEHVASLKESIRANGLDQPLLVWSGEEEGTLMDLGGTTGQVPATFLIAGNHRRTALNELQEEEAKWFAKTFPEGIPVVRRVCDIKAVIGAQLRENVQRLDMPAEQILPYAKRLRDDFGMKNAQIAKLVGKSPSWVTGVFSIEATLGSEGEDAVAAGKLPVGDAVKAATAVKQSKGKVTAKEALSKATKKAAEKKAKGKVRSDKRVSVKQIWARIKSGPKLALGAKVIMLEAAFSYAAGESDTLPKELVAADE